MMLQGCRGCDFQVADICWKMAAKGSESGGNSDGGGRNGQQRCRLRLWCDFVVACGVGCSKGKARTARYVPDRQLTGTRTGRYQAVPLKSAVGGRLREKSTVDNRLRKKKGRKKKKRKRRNTSPVRPRVTRAPSPPASPRRPRATFLPTWGDGTSPARGERSR
ncbi:hypothetical protein BHE74_00048048 [Ensete ventricosum]|nr:hypothetical protein BHE74_00048048 [Ensete ventricosum]